MICLSKGDITEANADAVVNAANEDLILGAGVAGAIRRSGGSCIQEECDRLSPIKTGEAVSTSAGLMKQKYVIHAVAPCGQVDNWQNLVATCIDNILDEAERLGINSVAIPAIGTGIFALPVNTVAGILIEGVRKRESSLNSVKRVEFVLFDDFTYNCFKEVLAAE